MRPKRFTPDAFLNIRTDEGDARWRTLPKVHTDQLTLDAIDGRRVVTGPER